MLYHLPIENILFLDIETVPQASGYQKLDERFKKSWEHEAAKLRKTDADTVENLYQKAGLYAEFGKIVCISVGFMNGNQFRVKSFYDDDEDRLLTDFQNLLNNFYNENGKFLCAHNGKEFDFPFIARRMIINGQKLPDILNVAVKKPWEMPFIDTMELWKFGNFKKYTSLNLLTTVFDIPTPKDDIDGSQVSRVYYEENDLERIKDYCQKDVVATFQIYRKYLNEPLIDEAFIEYLT
jgi:hypothetical protein